MKHVIRIGIAATAWLAVTLAAQGADLGRVPTYYRGFTPPPPVMWTGCYIGLNIGGGWSQATLFDPVAGVGLDGVSSGGVVGGAQAGCDYQMGRFVFGLQVMADGADIRGSRAQPNNPFVQNNLNIPWFETLTARAGFVLQPSTLLYVKGGGAWVRDNVWFTANGTNVANGIITPTGWTFGGGVEFLFFNNWSVFAEYNYLSFANTQITLINPAGGGAPVNFNHNVQTLLIGLNYRFSGPLSPSW
jgi:outer membrane immunogenic protein